MALLGVACLVCACSRGVDGADPGREVKGPTATAPPSPPPGPVFQVAVARVSLRDVTYTIEAVGSIEAQEEVQVVAGVEGIVTRVSFNEGDEVTPATVLALIDPDRYRVEAERAEANHQKIEAQHRLALSELERREELARQAPPLVSEEEVERARQEADRLRASVAEARALFELAKQDRERSIVRPLVLGVINRKSVSTGQHVEAKAVLATLVDRGRLRLRFKVSEQESVRIREGLTVRFSTSSWPGREFVATIFHVSSAADPMTRMVECLGRVADPASLLKPGFFAEVRADVESHRGAIVIPERAVLPTERGFLVYEVIDGVAAARPVSLGLRTRDGGVEILSGLGPTAVVVTDGGNVLRDGAPVQAIGQGS